MINVMYSGNAGVFPGILSSVLSLGKFNPEPVQVLILTMDLTDENPKYAPISAEQGAFIQELLQKTNPASGCRVVDMTEIYRADRDSMHYAERFTPYSLLRLYADQLPDLPDRILYLDADTLVLGRLDPLFKLDLTGYEIGACRDYMGRWFFGYNYFNSGVLLLNMPEIRATGLLARTRQMCIEKKMFLSDQTALNKCVKRKKLLPMRYNRQRRLDHDTVIRHYCGSWRFFPYIRVVTVKQWQTATVFADHHHVYNNPTVEALLREYLQLMERAPQP